MKKHTLLLLLMMVALASCNKSEPDPVREITSDYVLNADEDWRGTVRLKATVEVPVGRTLTIQPGTKIIAGEDGELDVNGSLTMNGTASKIIQIHAENENDGWIGIGFKGANLQMSYCTLADAIIGVFLFSTTSGSIKIDRCLFQNSSTAITDFTQDKTLSITNSTFLENDDAYNQWGGGKTVTIENCVFEGNSEAISLLSSSISNRKATTVEVQKSNFLKESSIGFITTSTTFPPYNTTFRATGCHGLVSGKYTLDRTKGNAITIQSAVSSPISGIGCGFSLQRSARKAFIENSLPSQELSKRFEERAQKALQRNTSNQ
ncbi:MAG: hypothetical protein ACK4GN_04125 [Runella sp.]